MLSLDEDDRREQYTAWLHTAALSTLVANIYRDPEKKKKPFTPDDFMPIKLPGNQAKEPKTSKQTWQDQKRIIEIYNAALGGSDHRKGR